MLQLFSPNLVIAVSVPDNRDGHDVAVMIPLPGISCTYLPIFFYATPMDRLFWARGFDYSPYVVRLIARWFISQRVLGYSPVHYYLVAASQAHGALEHEWEKIQ